MVGVTSADPLVAFVPDQPPLAVHEVELVLVQVSVELPPATMPVGFADRLTVGTPAGATVTVVVAAALPPAPLHDNA